MKEHEAVSSQCFEVANVCDASLQLANGVTELVTMHSSSRLLPFPINPMYLRKHHPLPRSQIRPCCSSLCMSPT